MSMLCWPRIIENRILATVRQRLPWMLSDREREAEERFAVQQPVEFAR